MNMTRFSKGPTDRGVAVIITAALVLVSAPVTAQESPSKPDTGADPASILALSSPVRIGVVEESLGPDPLFGLPASSALLSGLAEPRVLRIPASPPADGDLEDEDVGEGDIGDEDQEASQNVDAWGVAHNPGLATTLVILSNILANVVNEYVIQGDISQINPDSWWHNLIRKRARSGSTLSTKAATSSSRFPTMAAGSTWTGFV